jgi:pimeloyl-ACP methyl ester carboxylesterase
MNAKTYLTGALLAIMAAGSPVPPAAWKDGYVLANGIRIHYWRTGGNKTPLVMAHGSSDDGLCWTNLAKDLESSFDIIMVDARGHGLTDPPRPGDPVDVQADDLAGLIRELKLVKPIVMGHSMGSFAAAMFAAKYPDVPRGIVLEDPNLAQRRTGAASASTPADPQTRKAAVLARNNQSENELVAGCMKNSPKWGRSECEIWAPSKRRHHPDTALGRGVGARPPMSELLSKITAPTLILKADAQGELRQENERVAAMLKNGQIVHIEGAGHNVRRDAKARTLAALKPFLARLAGTPPGSSE